MLPLMRNTSFFISLPAWMLMMFLLFSGIQGAAQVQNKGFVAVEGIVFVNNMPISGVDVKVFQKGNEIHFGRSVDDGSFYFRLNLNEVYEVVIGRAGLVTKRFIFDTEIPDSEPSNEEFFFPLQLDLFPPLEEVDMSLLDEPMALIEFDPVNKIFSFDLDEAKEAVRRVKDKQKEIEEILKEKARQYKELFDLAEVSYKNKDFPLAREQYLKAREIYPAATARLYCDIDYLNNRIKGIDIYLADKEAKAKAKALKKAYDEAISKGDAAFGKKIYDEAGIYYNEALSLKPEESYPKKRIEKMQEIITKNVMINLSESTLLLKNGTEKRLNFKAIPSHLRRGNFILLKLQAKGDKSGKIFIKFGKNDQSAGGFVVKDLPTDQPKEYFIRVSSNDQWYRMDVNWISLYPEGCDIEVSEVRISRAD